MLLLELMYSACIPVFFQAVQNELTCLCFAEFCKMM